jgi:hypothetical protein
MTKLQVGEPGLDSRQGKKIFLFSIESGTNLASSAMGIEALSQGIKRQGREADHSPPSNAAVKNGGATDPPPSVLRTWCLIT